MAIPSETAWPETPHGGRNKDAFRVEFEKYPQITVRFFLGGTKTNK